MKILFTGASSFTGYWFAKALAEAGHEVTCTFTAESLDKYSDVRKKRVSLLGKFVKVEFGTAFGDDKFIQLIRKNKFDLLCHHGAFVQNYKSPDFDVAAALNNNVHNIYQTMMALLDSGCGNLIATGSVFEGGEGAGSDGLPHFSPYGLSKALTAQVLQFYAASFRMNYGKFVIPNPFGAYEEPRFTAYLMRAWLKRETPKVNTPDYVRDNIHVALLADYYKYFCENIRTLSLKKLSPSGIIGSQGAFTQMVAREVSSRLNIPCDFVLEKQTSFSEPLVRINTDRVNDVVNAFSEKKSWDAFVEYYARRAG